jgi:hypothetical protein
VGVQGDKYVSPRGGGGHKKSRKTVTVIFLSYRYLYILAYCLRFPLKNQEITSAGAHWMESDDSFQDEEGMRGSDREHVGDLEKSEVECICPGCRKRHKLNFHWIGRGIPRKFCQSCRNRETPMDGEIF